MKKSAFLSVIFILLLTAGSSCKREWTCACSYTDPYDTVRTKVYPINAFTKAEAKSACSANEYPIGGVKYYDCRFND